VTQTAVTNRVNGGLLRYYKEKGALLITTLGLHILDAQDSVSGLHKLQEIALKCSIIERQQRRRRKLHYRGGLRQGQMVCHPYSGCRARWKIFNRNSRPIQYEKDNNDGVRTCKRMEVV